MRPPFRLRFPLSAVLLAILAAAQLSCSTAPSLRRVPGSDISGIANGNPENQGGALGPSTYAEFDARNLNEAKVLWLNFDLLHEWGIDVPEGGLTPEFERELIEELAYMVPQADDPPHLFNDRMKKFFADRYGGAGMAGNYGSGRAGAAGKVQVKGIGVTPLKPEGVGFHHGHGGASIEGISPRSDFR